MSSASIMEAIHRKEYEIEECRLRISELEREIEQQKEAARRFDSTAEEFDHNIRYLSRKKDAIIDCATTITLADKYATKMDTIFNTSTWGKEQNDMLSIHSNMESEISRNEDELYSERARLTRLQNELSDLNVQYQAALRREEEEAAAARARAAAATAATATPPRRR